MNLAVGYRTFNMPAAVYNFEVEQGADFDYTLTWYDANRVVKNVTGYSARMKLRQGKPQNPTEALSLVSPVSSGTGITLGGAAGTIRVQIAAAITAGLEPALYSYDLELVNGTVVTRLMRGIAEVTAEVTR